MDVVRLRGVRAGYGRDQDVLSGIDLVVPEGRTVAVLGPSGGGKSTLLKVIAGLLPQRTGVVEVVGQPPGRAPRGTIGYVPQRLGLVRHTSVLDNVVHGGLHQTPWWATLAHRAPRSVVDRSRAAMRSVGLEGLAHRPIHRLSGGQQRRAAIARSIVQRPRLLLADEFLGEMDPRTVQTVVDALRGLQRDHGTTALFVEHHLDKARRFADTVYRLEDGRLEEVRA